VHDVQATTDGSDAKSWQQTPVAAMNVAYPAAHAAAVQSVV